MIRLGSIECDTVKWQDRCLSDAYLALLLIGCFGFMASMLVRAKDEHQGSSGNSESVAMHRSADIKHVNVSIGIKGWAENGHHS